MNKLTLCTTVGPCRSCTHTYTLRTRTLLLLHCRHFCGARKCLKVLAKECMHVHRLTLCTTVGPCRSCTHTYTLRTGTLLRLHCQHFCGACKCLKVLSKECMHVYRLRLCRTVGPCHSCTHTYTLCTGTLLLLHCRHFCGACECLEVLATECMHVYMITLCTIVGTTSQFITQTHRHTL